MECLTEAPQLSQRRRTAQRKASACSLPRLWAAVQRTQCRRAEPDAVSRQDHHLGCALTRVASAWRFGEARRLKAQGGCSGYAGAFLLRRRPLLCLVIIISHHVAAREQQIAPLRGTLHPDCCRFHLPQVIFRYRADATHRRKKLL